MSHNSNEVWYINLEVIRYIIDKLEWFKHMWEVTQQIVILDDNNMLKDKGIIEVSIIIDNDKDCYINDVLYKLELKKNLIAII